MSQPTGGSPGQAPGGTSQQDGAEGVMLPVPTAWPMVMALGVTLLIAGMVTHWIVSLLGLVLLGRSATGWFFEVLPQEHHLSVPVEAGIVAISSPRTRPARLSMDPRNRLRLPVETFSITAGVLGGIMGGIAMTVPATIFSLVRFHSPWYAVNLLAAGGFVSWAGRSDAFLAQFHLLGLLAATGIHGLTSVLVGLLYGAMLPMFPKRPILTAGFIAPLLWSGIVYSAMGAISPMMNARIDWLWFIVSQITFGLVCGFFVNLQVKVRTAQFQSLPFSVRAGLHSDRPHVGSFTPKDEDR
jgi:hypothetical protein